MAVGKVYNVDIIPNPGTDRGWIVVAKDRKLIQLPNSNLSNIRHQVIGDVIGIFTDSPAFMGTNGIEIAQKRHIPAMVSSMEIAQNLLNKKFGTAIRISRLKRKIFLYRYFMRIAIDGS